MTRTDRSGEGDDTKIRETYQDRTTTPYAVYWSLITQSLLLTLHVSVQLYTSVTWVCRPAGVTPAKTTRWSNPGSALACSPPPSRWRHGEHRLPEPGAPRWSCSRAVGVAARVLPQADQQREVTARLLLIRPPVGCSVTWLDRRLIHKRGVTV